MRTSLFLTCVVVASLGISNIFGMVFGLAMNKLPQKANEISGLMVMAIADGAIIPPVMGAVKGAVGPNGLVFVLLACLVYLLGLAFSLPSGRSPERRSGRASPKMIRGLVTADPYCRAVTPAGRVGCNREP